MNSRKNLFFLLLLAVNLLLAYQGIVFSKFRIYTDILADSRDNINETDALHCYNFQMIREI